MRTGFRMEFSVVMSMAGTPQPKFMLRADFFVYYIIGAEKVINFDLLKVFVLSELEFAQALRVFKSLCKNPLLKYCQVILAIVHASPTFAKKKKKKKKDCINKKFAKNSIFHFASFTPAVALTTTIWQNRLALTTVASCAVPTGWFGLGNSDTSFMRVLPLHLSVSLISVFHCTLKET